MTEKEARRDCRVSAVYRLNFETPNKVKGVMVWTKQY